MFPDLFAIVTLDGERTMTDRFKGGRYPFWNKSFVFERAKLGPELRITLRSGTGDDDVSSYSLFFSAP